MSHGVHGGRLREAEKRFGVPVRLDFSVNTNAFWTPPALPSAVASWAAATTYPEPDAARATLHLAHLHALDAASLLPCAGAIEGLYLAARLFHGGGACIPQPAFSDYARACLAAGMRVRYTPMPPHGLHSEAFQRWAQHHFSNAQLVVLGNPNNPTGRLWPHLRAALSAPGLEGVHWIIDEAFLEFVPDHESASLLRDLAAFPKVIVLRALTKSWAVPGLRIGFIACGNPEILGRLRSMQPPWSLNGFAEAWLLHSATSEARTAMLQSLAGLGQVRESFQRELAQLSEIHPWDSDANFLVVESAGVPVPKLAEDLGRIGILIRVCEGFEQLDAERHFRVAVRRPAENREFLRALASTLKAASQSRGARPPAEPLPLVSNSDALESAGPASSFWGAPGAARGMRALSVLGTSSNSGKSWMATALCAWLRKRGVRVAPFKAQNMSNHSAVAADGGEIGRAQAVQAEACGLSPSVHMNPILLKPSGQSRSQLVRLGRAEGHFAAADYYKLTESLWPTVVQSLEHWQSRCEVLVLEGAGSPVELNLLARDLVNLRPVRHLDARWLLVADIERGGVFAQAAGTWALLSPADRARCAGLVVNKFRGDKTLFADAARHFAPHFGAPLLGTLPFAPTLQPEAEDSLCLELPANSEGEPIHCIRFPHLSNGQDLHPWLMDQGVRLEWVDHPRSLDAARFLILPGSKDTLADLEWLRTTQLDAAILAAHQRGALVLGICGGFQMLGHTLSDPHGVAGKQGHARGLGLLPLDTVFESEKEVRSVRAAFHNDAWAAYEIHMGQSRLDPGTPPLFHVRPEEVHASQRPEGARLGRVWGSYLHGAFESTAFRRAAAARAGLSAFTPAACSFREQRQMLYAEMADFIEEHLNLEDLWRYVAH